jgi:lysophospholipid acyltransferase (LPLAT)-like uncharacterized protein
MKLKEINRNILRVAGNFILHWALKVLCKTLKIRNKNSVHVERLIKENKNFVLAFWHGTMIIPWYVHRDRRFVALVSRSKDGALLDKILRKWNYNVTRGSSHRGGSAALSAMINAAISEGSILITPDGPRGPANIMKPGAVIVAKKANIPLILLGVHHSRKKILKSWDRFEVPFFFSNVNLIYSDPICIDSDLSYEDTTQKIQDCQDLLNQLQLEAEKM